MKITQALLAVALLACTTKSFATLKSDPSNDPVGDVTFQTAPAFTGEPFDVYVVDISADNGCCSATIRMHANDASPDVAKFGVDDAIWEVKITQNELAYSVSVLQTNIHTQQTASAEIHQARMGHSTNFAFDGYSVRVTSALSTH